MSNLLNRAKMTVSATPGTGALPLGLAVSGYQTFAAAGAVDGQLVSYAIDDAGGAFGFGYGTWSLSAGTLARTTIQGSSNAGAAINASSAALVSAVALVSDMVPTVGQLAFFPGNPPGNSWYVLDGSLKMRATDPVLWAYAQASGNIAATDAAWTAGQFSPGDGATTFRLPKAAGYFFRALDTAGAIDPTARTIGSIEEDSFASHTHDYTDEGHTHGYNAGAAGYNVNGGSQTSSSAAPAAKTTASATIGITINNTGSSETAPKNIAYLACISRGM